MADWFDDNAPESEQQDWFAENAPTAVAEKAPATTEPAQDYGQKMQLDIPAQLAAQGPITRNITDALGETVAGFVPHSLSEALGFVSPIPGAISDIGKAGRLTSELASGVPLKTAVAESVPESQIIPQAEETPPYSKERFEAGLGMLAQLGTAAGIAHGIPRAQPSLHETITGTPAEVPRPSLELQTPAEIIAENQIKTEPTTQEVAPSASEVTSTARIPSEQVRPSVDEEASLRQSGETPEARQTEATGETIAGTEAEPVMPRFAERFDPETLFSRPAWVEPGSMLDKQLGEARELPDAFSNTRKDISPIWKTLTPDQRQDLVARGWQVRGTRNPNEVVLGIQADAVSARKYFSMQTQQALKPQATEPQPEPSTVPETPRTTGEPAVAAAEAAKEPLSLTSTKNEVVDQERAARGLPSAIEPAKKEFGASWDEASKKIDDNPSYPDQLIDELRTKPRALNDVENATLLHRQVDLQNQFQKATDQLFKATESGDEVGQMESDARAKALSDQLLDLYDVGKKAGTETGRGLAARRMLAAEDFSLANMITQKRAALKGAPLSDEQIGQVTKAAQKISARQVALDAYETSSKAEGYRKRLKTLTEQYKERTAAGDFTPRERPKIELDKDHERLRADLERAKQEFHTALAKDRAANRTPSQKFWDRFVGVERAMKLSSDVVLTKLTTAAAVREGVLTPVEEAVGGVVSKALPGLAKRAPREGGFSVDAEIKAKAEMFTSGMKDAWQNLKMKQTDLDTLYKAGRIKSPDEFYDYLGYLHGALKAPIKRAEFARSLTKRMKWTVEDGGDLNNPNTMRALSEQAYVDANRSIFLQDNVIADTFTAALRVAEQSKRAPNLGPAIARMGRFLVPIVKVPTNIVGEVATGVHGVATGGTRAAAAYIKGIESLPTEQGDAIMRQIKKGLVGNALLLTGYLAYDNIGGFYHEQDKREAGDVQPGRYRVGNVDVPASAGHSTGAMLLNIGATVHRVQDERIKKGGEETKGLGAGVLAAGQGLAHEVPFVPAGTNALEALGTKRGFEKYINNMIASTTTPALVTHVAKVMDTPGSFPQNLFDEAIKRQPKTPLQAFETTIPGLRQNVPEKAEKKK